jgi:hypothetical protein
VKRGRVYLHVMPPFAARTIVVPTKSVPRRIHGLRAPAETVTWKESTEQPGIEVTLPPPPVDGLPLVLVIELAEDTATPAPAATDAGAAVTPP